MSSSQKTPAADRHHGGPGSSHQDASKPQPEAHRGPAPGSPTSDSRSHVSGGGVGMMAVTLPAAGKAASRSH